MPTPSLQAGRFGLLNVGRTSLSQAAPATAAGGAGGLPAAAVISAFGTDTFKDISATAADPSSIWVSEDGTKVLIGSDDPDHDLYAHTMGTPFDVSTLSAVVTELSLGSNRNIGSFMHPLGTKVYYTTWTGASRIVEHTLSSAWDLTSAGSASTFETGASGSDFPFGVHFTPDGDKLYIVDNDANVRQYDLSTPWLITSASYIGLVDVSGQIAAGKSQDLTLSSDGTRLYALDLNIAPDTSEVFQYTLSTPFLVSTATYDTVLKDLGRISSGGLHMLSSQDRIFTVYNGDGADPESIEGWDIT